MIRSTNRKIIDDKKTRAAETIAPFTRFVHYKPYQKTVNFKSYIPLEDEPEEKKDEEEEEEGGEGTVKSMNAELGIKEGEAEPEKKKDIDD